MNNKIIKSILKEELEKEIPSSQIQLLPAIKSYYVAKNFNNSTDPGLKQITIKNQRRKQFSAAILIIISLVIFIFITPGGRTLAQNVWQLFIPTENNSFTAHSSTINTAEIDQVDSIPEDTTPLIKISEAEKIVGFDIKELPFIPNGLNYLGARVNGESVIIEYEAIGGGGTLLIQQSMEGYYQSKWDKVPQNDITSVMIGNISGEFVEGGFSVSPEKNNAVWNPDIDMMRLRWFDNGIWFELTKLGDVKVMEFIDQAYLIQLAESLTEK